MSINVCVGVLINKEKQVLLNSRPHGKVMAGYWEFPGGKIEAGESEFDAIKRELYEELGIDVISSHQIDEIMQEYSHGLVKLKIMQIDEWSGVATSKENQELKWQSLNEEVRLQPLLPTTTVILNKLKELYQ